MSEFKGTKAPWLRDGRTVYALQPSHAPHLSEVENRFSAGFYAGHGCSEQEAQANAQLAISAHELLDALLEMQRNGQKQGWKDKYESSMAKTRLAIAKALGQ